MPKRKATGFEWKGNAVSNYYDPSSQAENRKYYDSFVKNGVSYKIGDHAKFSENIDDPMSQKICEFKCLFEEQNENKAIVVIYEWAHKYNDLFISLHLEYDNTNEVVLDSTREELINLQCILRKCRVKFAHTYEKVDEIITSSNLNRVLYFICRYKFTQPSDLVPCLNEDNENDITIEETTLKKSTTLQTPSRKIISASKSMGVRKSNSEFMRFKGAETPANHLSQVKRNLNYSFNESSQDEKSFLNYSVVEQDNDRLKMKLRVSKGVVLSKIPVSQPVVLLDRVGSEFYKQNSIYEIKSPNYHKLLKNSVHIEDSSFRKPTHCSTPEKVLNKLDNLKIKDNSPVKRTPRKVRKLTELQCEENCSNTDSDDLTRRRKVAENRRGQSEYTETSDEPRRSTRKRKSTFNQDFITLNSLEATLSSRKHRQMNSSVLMSSDSESEVTEATPSSRKRRQANSQVLINSYSESEVTESIKKKVTTYQRDYKMALDDSPNPSRSTPKAKTLRARDRGIPMKMIENEISKVDSVRSTTPSTRSSVKASTPTTRTPRAPLKTPRRVRGTPLKMIRNGTLTPSVDQRLEVVEKCATPLIMARNTLHVSYVPKLLPCRENEYKDIYCFIRGKLRDRCGGCMYVSGVPGTGKTATVTAAIEDITKTWKKEGNCDFNYVSINGMKLTEPRQCYAEILKQLTGKRMPWEQALTLLEKQFTKKSSKKVVPTILLIDELDILCTKRQDVVYNLLDWPTKTNAQLIVVTIANTMDLPERLLMSRVTSRLGLTRLTFQAYTHKQLQEIVINRLSGNESFKADAIQFVARKVASVSGDARRALDICRRSAEIAELEGPHTQVSMKHVNAALEAMITQPKVKAILHCSKLEKLLLKAVIAEVDRTGLEETLFEDVCMTLRSIATLEGFKMVSISRVRAAVDKLTSCRLLLSDQSYYGLDQRILLNVSSDDVHYALKKD